MYGYSEHSVWLCDARLSIGQNIPSSCDAADTVSVVIILTSYVFLKWNAGSTVLLGTHFIILEKS